MADPESGLDGEDDLEILYFLLYFVLTCISVFFLIILVFICFSGRICVYIYYMVYKFQPPERERAPLIVETEYFPRPGYDGYCLMGRDEPTLIINHPEDSETDVEVEQDTKSVLVEAGLVLTRSIDIGTYDALSRSSYRDLNQHSPQTPSNYPRGILTPERHRRAQRRVKEPSLKAVSFNPKAEFKLLE